MNSQTFSKIINRIPRQVCHSVVLGLCLAICLSLSPAVARANWEKASQPPVAETPVDLALCAEKENCFFIHLH